MRRTALAFLIVVFIAKFASAQPAPFSERQQPPDNATLRDRMRARRASPFQPPAQMPEQTGENNLPAPVLVDKSLPLHKQVEHSIDLGVKFLLSQQQEDGSFGGGIGGTSVGQTALAGMALLSCGESHQSPELTKAIAFLKKTELDRGRMTYQIALRAAFYSQLPESIRKQELAADLKWLQDAMIKKGASAGMYTYD
jgi:hypothetical protein